MAPNDGRADIMRLPVALVATEECLGNPIVVGFLSSALITLLLVDINCLLLIAAFTLCMVYGINAGEMQMEIETSDDQRGR